MAYFPKTKVLKICELGSCGIYFETARDYQRFCTEAHRKQFIKELQQLGKCPHCGKELTRGNG